MEIQAYVEEWSRLPGQSVRMAISTSHDQVKASLERVVRGPSTEDGHEFGVPVEGLDAIVPGGVQKTAVGSYGRLPTEGMQFPLTLHSSIWATLPESESLQVIWAIGNENSRIAMGIQNSRLVVVDVAGRQVQGAGALQVDAYAWYSVVVTIDADGVVGVDAMQVSGHPAGPPRQAYGVGPAADSELLIEDILLSADDVDDAGSPIHAYNGKVGNVTVFGRVLSSDEAGLLHRGVSELAPERGWDFALGAEGVMLHGTTTSSRPGQLFNGGDRGVTGPNWTGRSDSFLDAPEEYGAIHFHDDDMVDANWQYNLDFSLPEHLASGVYMIRLEAGEDVDRYPLFVRGASTDEADVILVMPTNTYLAYANDRFASADLSSIMGHERHISADEAFLNERPEFGQSCYDTHSDGSPVRYSSRRRPLVNVRPHYPNWLTGTFRHFAVDLFLVEWLERRGVSYHVVTDQDVHDEGRQLLGRYKVVVTGSHPEYWSSPALQSLEDYLREGGRLMYLGGNGFYWVTSYDAQRPWIIEVRRDNGGLRSWDPPPGERTHVSTGEPGGLWRYRGRGPNTLAGVGFAMEGFSEGRGYERAPASYEGPARHFFAGIDTDLFGDYGFVLGGAAGDECDRFDRKLGSPSQTQVLASATGFGREYQIVNEDVLLPAPDQDGPNRPDMIRSDMVYLPVEGGGAVFSASSIAFAGAIAWNDFDNDVARLVDNVLGYFRTDLPTDD